MALSKRPCPSCGGPIHTGYARCLKCRRTDRYMPAEMSMTPVEAVSPAAPPAPEVDVAADRARRRAAFEHQQLKAKYQSALEQLTRQDALLSSLDALNANDGLFEIVPKESSGTSEGVVVMVASDWHVEQVVGPEVGGLNRFNPDIARERVTKFFQHGLRLIRLLQQDIKINTVVLALLGDFINGTIHEEFSDTNSSLPTDALTTAQTMLIGGIDFLLSHFEGNLVLPCHSGNHARMTQKTRFAVENGYSLEYLLYLSLAQKYANEPRVQFAIGTGMHSYMRIFDTTIRFQHGHAIKYLGGVGGLFIPANKSIAQWSAAKHADLDVFGHFHQLLDGSKFICNGSLVGYDSYALSIKASFEKPRQALFLLDRKRGRTATWPIILE